MSESLLEVQDLRKSYEGGQIQALAGVDLSVKAGDFVSISGASGSGKSTLLHMLGGLDLATSGNVLFKGKKLGTEWISTRIARGMWVHLSGVSPSAFFAGD